MYITVYFSNVEVVEILRNRMYAYILYITSSSKCDHMSSVTTWFDLEVTYWKSRTNGQTSRKRGFNYSNSSAYYTQTTRQWLLKSFLYTRSHLQLWEQSLIAISSQSNRSARNLTKSQTVLYGDSKDKFWVTAWLANTTWNLDLKQVNHKQILQSQIITEQLNQ